MKINDRLDDTGQVMVRAQKCNYPLNSISKYLLWLLEYAGGKDPDPSNFIFMWKTADGKTKKINLRLIFRGRYWKSLNEFSGVSIGKMNNSTFLICLSKKVNYAMRKMNIVEKPILMILARIVDIETKKNYIIDTF
jgi:hypothetical protein